jgi:hypothetical protein
VVQTSSTVRTVLTGRVADGPGPMDGCLLAQACRGLQDDRMTMAHEGLIIRPSLARFYSVPHQAVAGTARQRFGEVAPLEDH